MQHVFNETEALRRIGGEPDVLRELIEAFVESVSVGMAQIAAASERGDREQLAFVVHRFRGALAQLAAHRAHDAARFLEHAAEQAEEKDLRHAHSKLRREIDRLLPELHGLLGRSPTAEKILS